MTGRGHWFAGMFRLGGDVKDKLSALGEKVDLLTDLVMEVWFQ